MDKKTTLEKELSSNENMQIALSQVFMIFTEFEYTKEQVSDFLKSKIEECREISPLELINSALIYIKNGKEYSVNPDNKNIYKN